MKQFRCFYKNEFNEYMSMRADSVQKGTYLHDRKALLLFDEYLYANRIKTGEITEETVEGWMQTLTGKPVTVAAKVMTIRLFLQYLSKTGVKVFLPRIPKVHEDYIPYIFSDEETAKIFTAADNLQRYYNVKKNIYMHVEYPVILRLLYGCGLRLGEAVSLKMEDIDLDTGVLTLKETKKKKQRIVPLHCSLTEIVKVYCMKLGITGNPGYYMFPTDNFQEHITMKDARYYFDHILKRCEITYIRSKKHERGPCQHCFRHLFVLKSFMKAEDSGLRIDDAIPYLSIYLGHDSLTETEKYLKFSSELFPESMKKFNDFTQSLFPEVVYEK